VQIKVKSTPKFKPTLNTRSMELANENDQSDFLDRMEKFMIKKADASERRQSMSTLADQGVTFTPILTKKVDGMRARSMDELSQGDRLRREQKIRVMAARREEEEKDDLTFKPRLSSKGKDKTSMLKMAENPSFHLQLAQRRWDRRDKAAEEARKAREEKDSASCTFVPETKKCPAFIVRIADGMKMIQKARKDTGSSGSSVNVSTTNNASMMNDSSIRNPSPAKPSWRFT
jgi:hypothetical protein